MIIAHIGIRLTLKVLKEEIQANILKTSLLSKYVLQKTLYNLFLHRKNINFSLFHSITYAGRGSREPSANQHCFAQCISA